MAEKTNTPHTMDALSAGRPIAGFNQTHTIFWVGVSLALHIVLIVATSVGYIQDTYIDPEGAAKRHAVEAEKKAAAATQPSATAGGAVAKAGGGSTPGGGTGKTAAPAPGPGGGKPAETTGD